MAIVYRVENTKGEGVYQGGGFELLNVSTLENAYQPMPTRDHLIGSHFTKNFLGGVNIDEPWKHVHYGFTTKAQIKAWFPRRQWLAKLDKHGWTCGVYECPDALLGETQAVFNPETAKLVKKLRLTNLGPERKTKKVR